MAGRILLVDDSPDFRAMAAELLAAQGFELIENAADGEQPLGAAARRCPDAVLLDINLPGRDGFSVPASLAASCPSAGIVLTSADMVQVPPRMLKACAAWSSPTTTRICPGGPTVQS